MGTNDYRAGFVPDVTPITLEDGCAAIDRGKLADRIAGIHVLAVERYRLLKRIDV